MQLDGRRCQTVQTDKQAIVIGGGIAGLTTCYRLVTESAKRGIPLDVKLLEAGDRVGGAIHTSKQDGFVIEHGPDVFISTKPWAKALSEELGIADQFLSTNSRERRSFVLRKGKLYPVPDGFYLMAPASLMPFVKTPIFSWGGKLRMGLDWVIPRRRNDEDESLEGFITRRLGKEAFTRIAQPMIGGIYTADGKDLSLKATMPQFLEMEKKHGSIIKALVARKKESQGGASGTSGPRYSMFLSFKDGMQTLTDTLAERLPDDCIQLGAKVSSLDYQSQREMARSSSEWGTTGGGSGLCCAPCTPCSGLGRNSRSESVGIPRLYPLRILCHCEPRVSPQRILNTLSTEWVLLCPPLRNARLSDAHSAASNLRDVHQRIMPCYALMWVEQEAREKRISTVRNRR